MTFYDIIELLLKPIIKPINTPNYYKIGIMIGLIWSNSTDLNR